MVSAPSPGHQDVPLHGQAVVPLTILSRDALPSLADDDVRRWPWDRLVKPRDPPTPWVRGAKRVRSSATIDARGEQQHRRTGNLERALLRRNHARASTVAGYDPWKAVATRQSVVQRGERCSHDFPSFRCATPWRFWSAPRVWSPARFGRPSRHSRWPASSSSSMSPYSSLLALM